MSSQLSLFDLDHTLLNTNCSYRFGAYLYKHRQFNRLSMIYCVSCYAFHKWGLISLEELHEILFKRLFFGRLASSFRALASSFLDEEWESMIYVPAMKKLQEAQHGGYTAILSSSPDFLVELIAQRLGVHAHFGTTYQVDVEGRFCAIAELMNASVKVRYLHSLAKQWGISSQEITAYSDSVLDLSFLEAAGVAIGVNPDKKLRSICRKNQWKII